MPKGDRSTLEAIACLVLDESGDPCGICKAAHAADCVAAQRVRQVNI